MNTQARTRKSSAKHSARLGAYLATGISASTVATSTSNAAIVMLNIGSTGFNIDGVNGGLNPNSYRQISNFPFAGGGKLMIFNGYAQNFGLDGGMAASTLNLQFAINGGVTSPRNFALNEVIDVSALFSSNQGQTEFKYYGNTSPDFGPGSYMGFKAASGEFGWLEVTWNSKLSQFEILSGAYESTPGTAILAGATASVPEASSSLLALVAGGAALTRRRRQRAA